MTENRRTLQLFDNVFKLLMRLSGVAMVNFINGLFGTNYPPDSTVDYPSTEYVNKNLKKVMSDVIIIINGIHVYHIEAQIDDDENIAIRVFEYGFAEGIRTKTIDDDVITIKFPHSKIIYWETSSKTPDEVTLRLIFPDDSIYDYRVTTLKYLEHSIKDLEEQKLSILLPFYVLKLRKKVEGTKSHKRYKELASEMEKILTEISESVERCTNNGIMTKTDMLSVIEMINEMFNQLYTQYPEFEEAKAMIAEKYKFQWQVDMENRLAEEHEKYKYQWQIDMEKRLAEEHEKHKFQWQIDREEATRQAEEKTLEKAIRGLKLKNLDDDFIAEALGITIESVRAVQYLPENATNDQPND